MPQFKTRRAAYAAAFCMAVTVMAADTARAESTGPDWSGFHAGLTYTYAMGESRQDNSAGVTTGDYDINGSAGGLMIGYDWRAGDAVLGVEADFSIGDVSGDTTTVCPPSCYTEFEWYSTIRARAGYDLGMITPYVTAGVVLTQTSFGTRQLVAGEDLNDRDVNAGFTVGGGVEVDLSDRFFARAEYLYADLGEGMYHIRSQGASGEVPATAHMVRATIGHRFGAGAGSSDDADTESRFYLGVSGGYAAGSSRQDNSFPATTDDYDVNGALGGVFAGHDWIRNDVLFGLEADFALTDVDGQTNNGCGQLGCFTELEWLATTRARLGVQVGRFTPYVTAGLAIAKSKVGTRTPIVAGQPLGDSDVNVGPIGGAGIEIALTDSVSSRVEYLYGDLGDTVYFIPSQGQTGTVPTEKLSIVRAGLSYRF